MVTINVQYRLDAGCRAHILLYKNHEKQDYSELYLGTNASGYHRMMGGRTVYIHLNLGDILYWKAEHLEYKLIGGHQTNDLFHTTSCFHFVGN